MIKRIAFDIDGTLIEWKDEYFDSLFESFKNTGVDNPKKYQDLFLKVYDKIENNYKRMDKTILLNEFNKESDYKFSMNLIDNIIDTWSGCIPKSIDKKYYEVLEYLSSKYELVIVSNALLEIQRRRLQNLDLLKYFNKLYCSNIGLKPNKECFDNLKEDNYKEEEILVIGDNYDKDFMAPIKYGYKAILLDTNNKYILKENKISDIKELINIL